MPRTALPHPQPAGVCRPAAVAHGGIRLRRRAAACRSPASPSGCGCPSRTVLAAIGLTANIGLAYTLKFLWAPVLDQARRPDRWRIRPPPRLAARDPAGARRRLRAAGAVRPRGRAGRRGRPRRRWSPFSRPARTSRSTPGASRSSRPAAGRGDGGLCLGLPHRAADLRRGRDQVGATSWAGTARCSAWRRWSRSVRSSRCSPPSRDGLRAGAPPGRFAAWLARAVIEPLREFLTRPGAATILAFVALFKLGEAMAGVMTAPFYRALGFDRRRSPSRPDRFSLAATFAGTALGGWLVARLGVGRALLWTGWVQTHRDGDVCRCSPIRRASITCSTRPW